MVNQTLDVGNPYIGRRRTEHDEQIKAGERRGTSTRGHDFDFGEILADQMQAIEYGSTDDDRRAMLIIMEYGDLHPLAQFAFDVEAFRRFDIFEVDAAESRLKGSDGVDQFVWITFVDFDVEDVDVGEFLEQHALAFHHRLGSERANGSQAEDGRTVGDDADQIGAGGQRTGLARIGNDFLAGKSNTGRVRHRQIVLVG